MLSPTDARDWRYFFMMQEASDAADDAQHCYVTKDGLEEGAVGSHIDIKATNAQC